ncbi:hypothetical protein [Streptomyces sp. NPDC053542]|uniref:hypothetical protein n=1 Tax=Streptomyces sp. NPDC053542 TaxID=3365710 RepID=UPI0037D59E74
MRPPSLPEKVDVVVSTTVTGLAVPSLEARLVRRLGLRADVERVPLFGDGAAAVVAAGAQRAANPAGPQLVATRSRLHRIPAQSLYVATAT